MKKGRTVDNRRGDGSINDDNIRGNNDNDDDRNGRRRRRRGSRMVIAATFLLLLAAAATATTTTTSSFAFAPAKQFATTAAGGRRAPSLKKTTTSATTTRRTAAAAAFLSTPFSAIAATHSRRDGGGGVARFVASSSTREETTTSAEKKGGEGGGPVPMTLLGGFLGTGKTTTLKHLLENRDNIRIGVIVNDVAAVNIDAKLVSSASVAEANDGRDETKLTTTSDAVRAAGVDMVELRNGCACCSLADELFFSVEKLCRAVPDLDVIVVELSGVADPNAVRKNWRMAPDFARDMADVRRVVTLVDSQTFGTDYMTWDEAGDREGWINPLAAVDPAAPSRKVSELLAEQVESADVVVLNKIDLATSEEVETAAAVVRALNDKADIRRVRFGTVDPRTVVGIPDRQTIDGEEDPTTHAHSHGHHDHRGAEEQGTSPSSPSSSTSCADPECTDPSHAHSHHHHDHRAGHAEDAPSSTASSACTDPTCTDPSHDHSHNHDHHGQEEAACSDPACTDPTHDHGHASHDHHRRHETSTEELGISSFVYRAAVPFDAGRMMKILDRWPLPIKETLDLRYIRDGEFGDGAEDEDSPFAGVLRSKGFCWFAPTNWFARRRRGIMGREESDPWRHDTAMYWSHAGRHFGIESAGKWWATLSPENMRRYFYTDRHREEYDRIMREDFVSDEFGDRRQEIVFIGVGLDETAIREALDGCLLTDGEMRRYRKNSRKYADSLAAATAIKTTTTAKGRGLFDAAAAAGS